MERTTTAERRLEGNALASFVAPSCPSVVGGLPSGFGSGERWHGLGSVLEIRS